jgi:hypothetical protein
MSRGPDRLIPFLRKPESASGYGPQDFDLLLRQARSADLLARVAVLMEDRRGSGAVPAGFDAQAEGVRRKLRAHRAEVARELAFLVQALQGLDLPVVLLKGAAYLAAGLPPAQGRLFSDLDILVPRHRLPDVESALMLHGWIGTNDDPYDQQYYRLWSHELPPLVHMRRQTSLDVHHSISPPVSRWAVDGAALLEQARPLAGQPGLLTLAPCDLVLHSMLHLLINEELSHGLRDLSDIDLLLRHFAAVDPDFWTALPDRARQLRLQRPLHYALRLVRDVLGTPVAEQALAATRPATAWPARPLLLAAWRAALSAPHPSMGRFGPAVARWILYVRATWIRMPPLMLARHLWIKAWRRREGAAARPVAEPERIG